MGANAKLLSAIPFELVLQVRADSQDCLIQTPHATHGASCMYIESNRCLTPDDRVETAIYVGRDALRRCRIYGVVCPGYREETTDEFLNYSSATYLQDSSSKRRDKSSKLQAIRTPCVSESAKLFLGLFQSGGVAWRADLGPREANISYAIPKSLSGPCADFSIALFLNQFSFSSAEQPLGRLEFITDVYQEYAGQPESCLISVIDAFAYACLASQNGMVFDPKELAKKYGRALQITKRALADPNESRQDGTIVAVWLLSWYEVQKPATPEKGKAILEGFYAHQQGLMSLLRIRGLGALSSKRGKNIFWTMMGLIILRWLRTDAPCPEECCEWLDYIASMKHSDPRDGYLTMIAYDTYIYLIDSSKVNLRMTQLIQKFSDDVHADFRDIQIAFDAIDKRSVAANADEPVADIIRYNYIYHSVKMKLHHTMVQLIDSIACSAGSSAEFMKLQQRREKSLQFISHTAGDIMESISVQVKDRSMRWADVYNLMIPLSVVARLTTVPLHHRYQATNLVKRMGKDVGVMQALIEFISPARPNVNTATDGT